jgi:hypothetical protein
MTKDNNGKLKVEKAGLKEVTREGWEYELTVNLQLELSHLATASKDRTGLFMGKPEFIPSIETGKLIKQWCETGEEVRDELKEAIAGLEKCETVESLTAFKKTLPDHVATNQQFKDAGLKKYNTLKEKAEKEAKAA